MARGDLDAALADCDRAIDLAPDLAEAYHVRGLAHEKNEDWDRAVAEHTRAVALAPAQADYRCQRGRACHGKKDLTRAWRDFAKAIELDAGHADAHLGLAEVALETGKWNEAAKYCTAALELHHANPAAAYAYRGGAYFALERRREAAADVDQALKLDPKCGWAYLVGARLLDDVGKNAKAQDWYDMARALDARLAKTIEVQRQRHLRVLNNTEDELTVWVRYETLNEEGLWEWRPAGGEWGSWTVPAGKAINLADDSRLLEARQVRIYAVTDRGKTLGDRQKVWEVTSGKGYLGLAPNYFTYTIDP